MKIKLSNFLTILALFVEIVRAKLSKNLDSDSENGLKLERKKLCCSSVVPTGLCKDTLFSLPLIIYNAPQKVRG